MVNNNDFLVVLKDISNSLKKISETLRNIENLQRKETEQYLEDSKQKTEMPNKLVFLNSKGIPSLTK